MERKHFLENDGDDKRVTHYFFLNVSDSSHIIFFHQFSQEFLTDIIHNFFEKIWP